MARRRCAPGCSRAGPRRSRTPAEVLTRPGPLLWLLAGAASVLLLPWYGLEGARAAPAVWQALTGRAVLLPLLIPLLLVSLSLSRWRERAGVRVVHPDAAPARGSDKRRPTLLIAAGVFGLV